MKAKRNSSAYNAYHIKRDGRFLCEDPILKRFFHKGLAPSISFTEAHESKLNHCCEKCREKYFNRVSRINPPIIAPLILRKN